MNEETENKKTFDLYAFNLNDAIVCFLAGCMICINKDNVFPGLLIGIVVAVCMGIADSEKSKALVDEYFDRFHPEREIRQFHWFDLIALAAIIAEIIYFGFLDGDLGDGLDDEIVTGLILVYFAASHLIYLSMSKRN